MRIVAPLTSKDNQYKIPRDFFVFDTETWGLSPKPENFAFGVVYGHNYKKVIHSIKEFKEEFKHKRYNKKRIFAHNCEYDLLTIFGNVITEVDNSAIFNGKFISANYHKTQFCDSMNIYPASLDKIGGILGIPKLQIDDKFIVGRRCKITKSDIEYCIRDCEIVYEALLQMFIRIGGIKLTIASSAMYYFRKKFLKKPIVYSELNDEFFESYYGGRTEAFKLGKVDAKCYDLNSLYPAMMVKIKFPDFKNLKKYINVSVLEFLHIIKRNEGFAKVTVLHKNHTYGHLPFRCEIRKKLIFPIGQFTGSYNFNELRYCLEVGIIDIINVEYVVYSKPIESPFIEYVNQIYGERVETRNDLLKLILKLLLNSLYGKFGMREKYKTQYYHNIPYKLIEEIKTKGDFYELKLFAKDRNDCFLVTENKKAKATFFSIPSIASYITSSARIELLKGLRNNENNSIVYCDTDSIFLESTKNLNLRIGTELGAWKIEEKIIYEIRGLKNYSYFDKNGNNIESIKGINRNAKKIGENTYEIKKYYKTKEALRRRKESGENFKMIKVLRHKYDKRIVNNDGSTKPIKL